MTDQNSQFFAILTAIGKAKQANADALGVPWTFAQMGVGDANNTEPVPSEQQTRLINERRRAPLNQVKVDPNNPNIIIAEQVIPENIGGWWVREIGLYDAAGDLVAVANCAPTFKPLLTQGSGRTQVIRMILIVSNTANVELKIDPSVVLATRAYVDDSILSVLPPNKTAGTFTKVTIDKRGVVLSGANPTTLEGYGITDGFAASIVSTNYNNLLKTGLFVLGDGNTSNRPEGYSGSLALNHVLGDYGVTLSYNLGTDAVAFRRKEPAGFGPWRHFWHTGNFEPAAKADKSTSLAGYGVAFASQSEAETGADTNKPMNALRVFQAIVAKVIQATESALGIARIAPQILVSAGVDDSTIVTPKKAAALFPFRGRAVYSVPGVYTWNVPAGVTKAWVVVYGAGGGGGRSLVLPGPSGGAGGGIARKLFDLTGINSVTITVGAGGVGAVTTENIGGQGGASSFGSTLSATGGAGGTINGNGPSAGTGVGGDENASRGAGGVPMGTSYNNTFYGGAGGGGESIAARASNTKPKTPGMGGGGRADSAAPDGADGMVSIQW